ncbi:MAG: hypothetical protein V3V13_02555 [Paracoccaceae bacterium]
MHPDTSKGYLSAEFIHQHGTISALAARMVEAYKTYGQGGLEVPAKTVIAGGTPRSLFLTMPVYYQTKDMFMVKIGTFFARSPNCLLPTIHADVLVYSAKTGQRQTIIDGAALTNFKCAAITAVVTERCAHRSAKILAIIGSGVQALEQARGVCTVRDISEIRIFSRTPKHAQRFAAALRQEMPELDIKVYSSIAKVTRDADIISTTTSSKTPLDQFANTRADVHFNCMGAHDSAGRELPNSLIRNSTTIVEDINTALEEAGPAHINALDLQKLIKDKTRDFTAEKTVFSSTGHAYLDAITAAYLLEVQTEFQHGPCAE